MAYVLRLEDLARDVHAHTVGAAVAAAFGAQQTGGDRPDWETVKAAFDADLALPPAGHGAVDNSTRGIKLRALGVGR